MNDRTGSEGAAESSSDRSSAIERVSGRIRKEMRRQGIRGLSIAVAETLSVLGVELKRR